MKKSESKKLIKRYPLAVISLPGNASAFAVYQEVYEDGSERVVHGHSVRSVPTFTQLNARTKAQKKRAKEEFRPDLYHLIQIAGMVNREIEAVCLKLDSSRGLTEV